MGKVFFQMDENVGFWIEAAGVFDYICLFFKRFSNKKHASQTFLRRPFERIYSRIEFLSGSAMCPSYAAHMVAAAFRAGTDIDVPYSF